MQRQTKFLILILSILLSYNIFYVYIIWHELCFPCIFLISVLLLFAILLLVKVVKRIDEFCEEKKEGLLEIKNIIDEMIVEERKKNPQSPLLGDLKNWSSEIDKKT